MISQLRRKLTHAADDKIHLIFLVMSLLHILLPGTRSSSEHCIIQKEMQVLEASEEQGQRDLGRSWDVDTPESSGRLGQREEDSFQSVANDLQRSCAAVISQIRWQVTATDVPNICGELITH